MNTSQTVAAILQDFAPQSPTTTANALRTYWLEFEPNRGIELIKQEQREQQETSGTPIPALKAIGNEVAKQARVRPDDFLPLAQTLWDNYGREGRVVALIVLGSIELVQPDETVPLLEKLCAQCISWEEADRLAMDALEPIVRKQPEEWLPALEAWLVDDNPWARRAAVTVVARLPMKHPAYTQRCLELSEKLLLDEEMDVKRALSFAIRLCAKAEPGLVRQFLAKHVPPSQAEATWVLCDVIRSMGKKILPEFTPLLPLYEGWAAKPGLDKKDLRSIQSAISTLRTQSNPE